MTDPTVPEMLEWAQWKLATALPADDRRVIFAMGNFINDHRAILESLRWRKVSEELPDKSVCVMGCWVTEGGQSFHHVWYFAPDDVTRVSLIPNDEGWMVVKSQTGHTRKPDCWIPMTAFREVPVKYEMPEIEPEEPNDE